MASYEKTTIRDNSVSVLHRKLPGNCAMQDVDFYLYDYNSEDAIAMLEIKHSNELNKSTLDLNTKQMRVHRKMANKLEIPFFMLIDDTQFAGHVNYIIIAANSIAKEFMAKYKFGNILHLSHREYYKFECLLRKVQYKQSWTITELDKFNNRQNVLMTLNDLSNKKSAVKEFKVIDFE